MKINIIPPGVDPIEEYGDRPAPRSPLAGCVGPVVIMLALAGLIAGVGPQLMASDAPTEIPTAAMLPTITVTPTTTATITPSPSATIPPSSTRPPTSTPTMTPTVTFTPTFTPTATRQPWVDGIVANAPELNVRAGPGRGYPALDRLRRGTPVRVIAREPGGVWGKIDSPVLGWVHLSYIMPADGQADNLVWLPVITDLPLLY